MKKTNTRKGLLIKQHGGLKTFLKLNTLEKTSPLHILRSHLWSKIYLKYSVVPDFFTAFPSFVCV